MTKANKVLFITQEITPYVSESEMANIGRNLPQAIQEKGREIRTFMPKWGNINERRNQLHEVIRLSGMNLIIDDTDHPLIIKVASIQSARMQRQPRYLLCAWCIGNREETSLVSRCNSLSWLDDSVSTSLY